MKRKTGAGLRKQIRNKVKSEKQEVKDQFKKDKKAQWLPGGSTLYNLACSDRRSGAYRCGRMINIIGDSSSGKSILALSGLAEIANNPKFDDYRLIYDDAEFADSFNHQKLFGKKFTKRLEPPAVTKETKEPFFSTTIEQFFDNVMDALDNDKPFVYILDSFDAIDADAEIKKELDNRKQRKKGNLSKIKGSFQATKQKKASQMFRQICSKLEKSNSLLIIISQTRDNLDAFSFVKQYRAGGRALKFYCSIEVWLTYAGAITRTINEIQYKIGVKTIAKISKNKFTGKLREVEFSIYYDYGVDNIASCIAFLVKHKYWLKKKQTIIAEELGVKKPEKALIQYIEQNSKEAILYQETQRCWNEVETALRLGRKGKYE